MNVWWLIGIGVLAYFLFVFLILGFFQVATRYDNDDDYTYKIDKKN